MNLLKSLLLMITVSLSISQGYSVEKNEPGSTLIDKLSFGNTSSEMHLYLFTDWLCPVCKKLEPRLKDIVPPIMKVARITFVDFIIHPESKNFTPYNVSFMLHNKPQYIQLRTVLDELSSKNVTPTENQVLTAIKQVQGVEYKKLNHLEVLAVKNYFNTMVQKFEVNSTPTLVIENKKSKEFKKLKGPAEITEENIMRTIESLQKS